MNCNDRRILVSIIILARDEEANLPRLPESIRWCDDIHLVDSASCDRTIVGACSVVTHDLPENIIAAGNPCKVLRI
jgi:hypothetical protein